MGTELIAATFVFVAVAALVVALTSRSAGTKVERRLSQLNQKREAAPVESVLRSDSGTFPFLRRLATGNAWSENAARQLAQAGWSIKVSEFLLIRICVAVIVAVAVMLPVNSSAGLFLAMAGGAAGFIAPGFVLGYYRNKRQRAINGQLVETLGLISNALRSGFAFTQAVELAVKQLDPPIADELNRYMHDVSLGASTDVALQQLADRTESVDIDMMVATIMIQRTTGGNLSEILDNVAETVRDRERLQGEIRALTASQRFTGLVLSVYPVLLCALFLAIAPSTWKILFTEEVGRMLVAVAAVLQVIGVISIRRILKLEV